MPAVVETPIVLGSTMIAALLGPVMGIALVAILVALGVLAAGIVQERREAVRGMRVVIPGRGIATLR
jgi:hypothetical protein